MFLAVPQHVWKVQDLHSYTVFLNTKQNVQFRFSLLCFFDRERLPATERDLKENYDRQESRAPRLV